MRTRLRNLASPAAASLIVITALILVAGFAWAEPSTTELFVRDSASVLRHLEGSFKGNAIQNGYSDRELHFSLSIPLGALGCQLSALVLRQNPPQWQSVLGGVAFGMIPGFAKEFHDMAQINNYFSWRDLGYDIVGVLSGALIVWVVHRAFSRAQLQRTTFETY